MRDQPGLRGLVVIGRHHQRGIGPHGLAWRIRRIPSAVLFDPAPAITGTRPAANFTTASTTASCSSWLSVGLSPVVPTGTSPADPSAICQSTSFLQRVHVDIAVPERRDKGGDRPADPALDHGTLPLQGTRGPVEIGPCLAPGGRFAKRRRSAPC